MGGAAPRHMNNIKYIKNREQYLRVPYSSSVRALTWRQ